MPYFNPRKQKKPVLQFSDKLEKVCLGLFGQKPGNQIFPEKRSGLDLSLHWPLLTCMNPEKPDIPMKEKSPFFVHFRSICVHFEPVFAGKTGNPKVGKWDFS